MKNKLLPKIMTLFLTIVALNQELISQVCTGGVYNHIDCEIEVVEDGFHIDTLNSTANLKKHIHTFSVFPENGCWDIPSDTTFGFYSCHTCGFSDSAIYADANLPSSSTIYKFFSLKTSSSNHVLFDWNDILEYNSKYYPNLIIPDNPYCCSSNPPSDCQTCNCAVG